MGFYQHWEPPPRPPRQGSDGSDDEEEPNPRRPRRGGVAIYVRDTLVARRMDLPAHLTHLQMVHVELIWHQNVLNLFGMYVGPREDLPVAALQYVAILPKAILCGDLNARHTAFGDHACNPKGNVLIGVLEAEALSALPICRATRSLTFMAADHPLMTMC